MNSETLASISLQGAERRWPIAFRPTSEEFTLCLQHAECHLEKSVDLDLQQLYDDTCFFLDQDGRRMTADTTRVLASMADGRIGWLPGSSQSDDHICLIQGAAFPFVLRARGDGTFAVVGDSYIHGIMHGEAWPEDEAELKGITIT